ncbi:hypothetical protein WA1_26745 [Scytonema hofmannii PCC 7110]|uniref:Uncharacterized protein n=1 Tax=Scytonema hofmannii PCC 7110 TaxID=128403 RepID=A0A139X6Z5_9CYAN|nr:hypothetical protein WA1_26745 [Scytonema hofmannii PCC 7110]
MSGCKMNCIVSLGAIFGISNLALTPPGIVGSGVRSPGVFAPETSRKVKVCSMFIFGETAVKTAIDETKKFKYASFDYPFTKIVSMRK